MLKYAPSASSVIHTNPPSGGISRETGANSQKRMTGMQQSTDTDNTGDSNKTKRITHTILLFIGV